MKKIFITLSFFLFIVPIGTSQDLPSYVPSDGLVAYYPFNGNANDASGNNYHGVVNGATSSTDFKGEINSAYSFDGDDDYITTSTILDNVFENFTFSVWVKPQATEDISWTEGSIVFASSQYKQPVIHPTHGQSYGDESNSAGAGLYVGTNGLIVVEHSHDYVRNALIFETSLSSWNHITVVYKSNKPELYLNGSFVKSFPAGNRTVFASLGDDITDRANYSKSGFGSGFYPHLFQNFSGLIDEIIVWNRALSQNEIGNMYSSYSSDILLKGTISAENNQIKNLAAPTNINDAVTLGFLLDKINDLQEQINTLQGSEGGNLTDNEGNSYPYVTYGNQKWTTKNIEITTYTDGTSIPEVTDPNEWANLTTGAWCYKNNDPSTETKFYNWYAVNGVHDDDPNTANKKFAPEGWSVPTKTDWEVLQDFLISSGYNHDGTVTGNKIAKSMSSKTGWNPSENVGAPGNNLSLNNSSNFNAYPHGNRISNGNFGFSSEYATFWSSTESSDDTNKAYLYYLNKNLVGLILPAHDPKNGGFPVRLVRND